MLLSLLSFLISQPTVVAQNTPKVSVSRSVDNDRDGFSGTQDLCPKIPGKNQGCPAIKLFRAPQKHDLVFTLFDEDQFSVIEKDEIRIGDIFSSGIYDKISGKIWNESEGVEVTK